MNLQLDCQYADSPIFGNGKTSFYVVLLVSYEWVAIEGASIEKKSSSFLHMLGYFSFVPQLRVDNFW